MKWSAIVVAASLLLLACNKDRGPDCQKLVQVAGPQHAALAAAFSRSDQPPSELETQAAGFEAGAKELSSLDVKDEGVKSLASDYASVLTKGAKIRRDLAAASSDPAELGKAQASAVAFMVEETQAKAKIDATCR